MDPLAQLGLIEGANTFADLAATFRDALITRDFSNAPPK